MIGPKDKVMLNLLGISQGSSSAKECDSTVTPHSTPGLLGRREGHFPRTFFSPKERPERCSDSLSEAPKASGMDPGTMERPVPAYPLSDRKKISPEKKWTEGLALG